MFFPFFSRGLDLSRALSPLKKHYDQSARWRGVMVLRGAEGDLRPTAGVSAVGRGGWGELARLLME